MRCPSGAHSRRHSRARVRHKVSRELRAVRFPALTLYSHSQTPYSHSQTQPDTIQSQLDTIQSQLNTIQSQLDTIQTAYSHSQTPLIKRLRQTHSDTDAEWETQRGNQRMSMRNLCLEFL